MPRLNITIGQATFPLYPVLPFGRDSAYLSNLGWNALLRYPREIYRWSCKTKTGRPDPRPATFPVDADLVFVAPPRPEARPFDPTWPDESGAQATERLLRITGATDMDAIRKRIDDLFGATDLPIPYGELLDPFAEKTSRLISVREEYIRFFLAFSAFPELPEERGRIPRICYLMVPLSVLFESQVVGVCDGGNPARGLGLMAAKQVPLELTEAGQAMAKVYQAEVDRVLFEDG
jgi:hypothetical protein